jgi:hypothetical protein
MHSLGTAALTTLLLPALLPLGAQAQTPPMPVLTPAHTRPLLDAPGDGSAWALGETYKLGLSADGARMAPLLGSRVERPQWLLLGVPELWVGEQRVPTYPGEAEVNGQRLSIDRGWFEERFDCSADNVEHSFLIESRAALPVHGDLVFSLPTSGDLVAAGREQGQRFEVRGAGGERLSTLTYGDWLARDAMGREVRGLTGFSDGALTITVPADFWQSAAFPLLVDPVISVFNVSASNDANETDSDVSYDLSNDVWLVVFTDSGNDNDDDVFARRYTSAGAFLEEVAVDIDGENESSPRVANNNKHNAFLVVWAREQDLFNTDRIQGRRRLAGSTTQSASFNISSGSNERRPDVGGTSDLSSDQWAVVWEESSAGLTARSLALASVDQNQVVVQRPDLYQGGLPLVNPIPESIVASISSSAGEFRNWLVGFAVERGPTFFEIRARTVSAAGFQVSNALLVDPAQGLQPDPSVAGNGRDFLMAFTDGGNAKSVLGFPLSLDTALSAGPILGLTDLLEGAGESVPQEQASLTGDGCRYVLSYRQGNGGTADFDVRCASFVVTKSGDLSVPKVTVTDPPVSVQTTPQEDRQPAFAIAADGGGSSLQAFGTWTQVTSPGNLNLIGCRYRPAQLSGIGSIPSGCGGQFAEPGLFIEGLPELGQTLELELSPALGGPGAPLILIGEQTLLPLCPGQATCSLGVGNVYLSVGATSTQITIPCKIGFLGAVIAIQGAFFGVSSSSACGAPFYAINFRVSDTALLTIG